VRLAGAVDFTFPSMLLAPGRYVVVVEDVAAFRARYGAAVPVAGDYSGALSNGGENIELLLPEPYALAIQDFTYDDAWYPATDGDGYSLVIRDAAAADGAWDVPGGWRASLDPFGSPGDDDFMLGDVNRDQRVGLLDLGQMQQRLGQNTTLGPVDGDLNRDGRVSRADLAILAANLGRSAPAPAAPLAATASVAAASVAAAGAPAAAGASSVPGALSSPGALAVPGALQAPPIAGRRLPIDIRPPSIVSLPSAAPLRVLPQGLSARVARSQSQPAGSDQASLATAADAPPARPGLASTRIRTHRTAAPNTSAQHTTAPNTRAPLAGTPSPAAVDAILAQGADEWAPGE
jgi:hypothetical protein